MRLKSKVALVTGGYGGMGRTSARLFAREGATVFDAGRNHERGDELVEEINVTGTLRGIQTCAPLIKDSGGGSIVNIGSVAGITGGFGTGYSSSKWALERLSRSAAYFTPTGASAQTSSSPTGSKPT